MANRYTDKPWCTRRPPPNERGELYCRNCDSWHPPSAFKINKRLKYGLDHFCRTCRKARTNEIQWRLHGKKPWAEYSASRHVPPSVCNKCWKKKPLSEFAKTKTKRGHFYTCRECENKRHAAYLNDPAYRERRRENGRRCRERGKNNPERIKKNAVRRITLEAVKAGFIKKLPCAKCGDPKVQAHHADYDKPFEVEWLCKTHHWETHRSS